MDKSTLGKVALTAVVAVAGVGFFVSSSFSSAEHYMMVDALLASGEQNWVGKELKVHGWVEAGSIKESVIDQETHRTFLLQKGGKKIRVFSVGPKPDTFKDQSEVVATGHLVPTEKMRETAQRLGVSIETDMPYVVDSTELMAKCPSKYDGAQGVKKLENVPEFK